MNKLFLAAVAMAAMVPSVYAAQSVVIVPVVDLTIAAGGRVDGTTYVPDAGVPGGDKFLVHTNASPLAPAVYNTAGVKEGNLASTSVTPTGLGFFGLAAGIDGVIYGYEDGGKDLWKWDSVSDATPNLAFDGAAFTRVAVVLGTGANTVVATAGTILVSDPTVEGPIQVFTGSAPFVSGTLEPVGAKSALAMSTNYDIAYAMKDSNAPVRKFVRTNGTWAVDATWVLPKTTVGGAVNTIGGPMAYDTLNDVLFVAPTASGLNSKVLAYDGTTGGDPIGEFTFSSLIHLASGGYNGSFVVPNGLGGTVGMAARGGVVSSDAIFRKFTYVVTPDAGVDTWSLY